MAMTMMVLTIDDDDDDDDNDNDNDNDNNNNNKIIMSLSSSSLLVIFLNLRLEWFRLMLMIVKKPAPGCSGQPAVLDQLSGQFTSPDFGDGRRYAAGLACSWLIVTAPDTVRQCQSVLLLAVGYLTL